MGSFCAKLTYVSVVDMPTSQQKLHTAMSYAMAHRPSVGGFPFLAECLRQAGVEKNIWLLPGAQSIYLMKEGNGVQQGTPLVSGMSDIPVFDKEALITALRIDQKGESTFPEFLSASWNAGVGSYEVDFIARTVTYRGIRGEEYIESYPPVEIGDMHI